MGPARGPRPSAWQAATGLGGVIGLLYLKCDPSLANHWSQGQFDYPNIPLNGRGVMATVTGCRTPPGEVGGTGGDRTR
eukprot:646306-Hanusia_phi.AAC.2